MHPDRICAAFVITVALFGAVCGQSAAADPAAPATPQTSPLLLPSPGGPLVPSRSGERKLLAIGDSLTARITPLLPGYLPGWDVGINGVGGRPLRTGMDILDSYTIPAGTVLAMGLFTNDDPRNVPQLKSAVRESLRRVGPGGCVIWSTIYRPKVNGVSYRAANEALRDLAAENPQMRLVKWSEAVRRLRFPMDRTDVHPRSLYGWQKRAQLYADAARSC